jgi:two-component system, sensor histidine kinase
MALLKNSIEGHAPRHIFLNNNCVNICRMETKTAAPDSINHLVRHEQVALLYRLSLPALIAGVVPVIAFWAVVQKVFPGSALVTWTVITSLFCVIRLSFSVIYLVIKPQPNRTRLWSMLFAVSTVVFGLLWVYGILVFRPPSHFAELQRYVTAISVSIGFGALPFFLATQWAFALHLASLTIILDLYLIFFSSASDMAFGLLSLFFAAFMVFGAVMLARQIRDKIRMSLEEAALSREVQMARMRTEETNKLLVSEITERKKAERELFAAMGRAEEAKAMAEKANHAKSQFIANVSHELRTPLNGVLGTTELLLDSNLDDNQRILASTAHESGRLLLGTIGNILDFSKIEAGDIVLEQSLFDVRSVMTDGIKFLKSEAHHKGLKWTCVISENVPPKVVGDEMHLRQVLINLVGNAIKFTSEGLISLSVTTLDRKDESILLEFSLTDKGIGIDQESQSRIFSAFSQADGSATRRYGGTGLGLTISKELVEMMGGEISVKSRPGEGSTFTFTVRVLLPQPTHDDLSGGRDMFKDNSIEDALQFDGVTILLAEDNRVNQFIADAMLKKLGCRVDIVENGRDALESCLVREYDLVFMDCQMPLMDGIEATAELRRMKGASLPIVALTAHASEQDKHMCLSAGMNDYLAKPFNLSQLLTVLERNLP